MRNTCIFTKIFTAVDLGDGQSLMWLSLVSLKKLFRAFYLVKVHSSRVPVLRSSVNVGGYLETPARLTTDSSSPSSALSGSRVHTRVYEDLRLIGVRGNAAAEHLREVVCGW